MSEPSLFPRDVVEQGPVSVVTGGSGFLGSHLTDRLLKEGHSVIAVDNLVTGNTRNIGHLAGNARFRFVKHDVSQHIFLPGKVDYVWHFASPASPIDYLELPIPTLKVGALGTHNSLGLAKAKGAKYLLASTSECYGDPLIHPQREDYWGNVNPIGPRGCYDEAKRFAEAMTMAYHREHKSPRASCASSTPTARACACATAAWCRPSSARRSPAGRSRSSATGARRARSAT